MKMKFRSSSCLDLKVKPPKIPSKSKKIYRGIFIRKLQRLNYMYALDGLFIASLHTDKDVFVWIDKNINKIRERIDELNRVSNNNTYTNSVEKEEQGNLFS